MTNIPKGKPKKKGSKNRGLELKIRNLPEFEEDLFGLPKGQDFPEDHYEFKSWATVGTIGTGKTTINKGYFGNKIAEEWGESNVDFFILQDLWAIIEAIKNSPKQVHYVIIDDAVPLFDSRQSMKSENISVSQFYFEIRHQLNKHAEESEGNAGGLVFLSIIVQDFSALDIRLRKAILFIVYKTFDDSLDKRKDIEYEVKRVLKKMKYQAALRLDYFWRQLAVGIDCEDKYTFFKADVTNMKQIKFLYVTGENLYERDKMHLIYYLVEKVNLEKKKWYIKGKLYEEIAKMKLKSTYVRVSKADFGEVIERAKTVVEDQKEDETEDQRKHREHLINHLVNNFDVNQKNWYFKASLMEEIEHIKEEGEHITIQNSEMERLILLAKKKAIDKIEKAKKLEGNSNLDKDGNWDAAKIVYYRIVERLTYKQIEENHGIPKSTAQRVYNKFITSMKSPLDNDTKLKEQKCES